MYGFTAVVGPDFWSQSLLASLGSRGNHIPSFIYNLSWTDFYVGYGGVVLVFNTVSSALNVMAARRLRREPATLALYGLLPFFFAWTFIVAYLYLNPIILHAHLVPFVLYVGLINALSVGTMITAHLTKSEFPMFNILVAPLVLGVVDSIGPVLQDAVGLGWPSALGDGSYQVVFVALCLGFAIGVYGTFVVDVIVTICDYLDIWCLTIKHPKNTDGSKKTA